MNKDKRLSRDTGTFLKDPHNKIFISVASIWEIVIKRGKKMLKVPKDLEEGVKVSDFQLLSIEMRHVLEIEKLPRYHNDPFDRILIAQARAENLIFVTDDTKIKKYDVKTV